MSDSNAPRANGLRPHLAALMRDLESAYRTRMANLPNARIPPGSWPAIVYRAGARTFLTPLEQVAEVLDLPQSITPVPGVASVLLGVLNHRGALLPVYDLARFIGDTEPQRDHPHSVRGRILVVHQSGPSCGLLVTRALGKRYIAETDRCDQQAEPIETCAAIQPFASGVYRVDEHPVTAIDLAQLMASPLADAANVGQQAAPRRSDHEGNAAVGHHGR